MVIMVYIRDTNQARHPITVSDCVLESTIVIMISNRIRGIASLTTACQCVLTLLLFSSWVAIYQLVSGARQFNLQAYGSYALFIILGLLFDSVIREPTPLFGLLRQPNLVRVIPRALRQATIAIGSLLLMLVLSKDQHLSRLFLFTFVPVFYPMILLSAHFLPKLLSRNLFKGAQLERVLLVGSPARAERIRDWLSAKRAYGVHTVGILTEEETGREWLPVLGTPAQLKTVLATQGITHVIYLRLPDPATDFSEVLETVQKRGVRLVILSDLDAQMNHPTCSVVEDGLTFFSMHPEPLENPFNRGMKRLNDLVIAVPAVLIVLPIATVIVKIMHLLQSPGPLLYRFDPRRHPQSRLRHSDFGPCSPEMMNRRGRPPRATHEFSRPGIGCDVSALMSSPSSQRFVRQNEHRGSWRVER